jgi:thioredoxin 1
MLSSSLALPKPKVLSMPKQTDFFENLNRNPNPVVVDFWAPWCAPCRSITPALKQLGKKYEGQVDVWKVNADEQPDLLRQLRIYGIPTLIVYKNGQEITRRTGAPSRDGLEALFLSALSGEQPDRSGLTTLDRILRLGSGFVLIALAYSGGFSGLYALLALLGAGIAFSGVHDRCPIWQAIAPKLESLLRRNSSAQIRESGERQKP